MSDELSDILTFVSIDRSVTKISTISLGAISRKSQ